MFKINIHEHSEWISNFIRENKYWDKIDTEILNEIFKNNKNMIFVDIGANIGYFCLFSASKGIKSIGFEPIKENYELFEKSIKDNEFEDLIRLYKVAIGNSRKTYKFNIINYNMGCCTTYDYIYNYSTPDSIVEANCMFGDDFLLKINSDIVLKIDVENMESDVLKGLKNTLEKGSIKYIIIEISKQTDKSIEIFDILERYGYARCIIHNDIDIDNNSGINYNSSHLDRTELYRSIHYVKSLYEKIDKKDQINACFFKDKLHD